jgi:Transposase, Mutator family
MQPLYCRPWLCLRQRRQRLCLPPLPYAQPITPALLRHSVPTQTPGHPNERLNKEIRHRTDVVGIFPDRNAIISLVGAVLPEQHDDWAEGRRYLGTTTEEVRAEYTL